jgi:hypothetical protein
MKGWRTLIVNVAAAILPITDLLANNGGVLGPAGGVAVAVLGGLNIFLRMLTTTPIFEGRK